MPAILLLASIIYMRYHLSMTTVPPNNKNNELNDRASLIASLTAFSLQHILRIIIESSQNGELYVGGTDQDGRAWIDNGKITGFSVSTLDNSVTSAEKALFEMALFDNAWAYFTLGRAAPTNTCSEELKGIVDRIGPQLEEYHSLIKKMPLNATVRLNQDSPSDSVQMSSAQWKVLTKIGSGTGQQVRDIISSTDVSQVDTLKILDQLVAAQLIAVEKADESTFPNAAANAAPSGNSSNVGNASISNPAETITVSTIPSTTTIPPVGLPTALSDETPPVLASLPAPTPVPPSASGTSAESTPTDPGSMPTSTTTTPPAGSTPLSSVNTSEPDREVVNALRETVDPLGGFILVTDSPARYDTRPEQQSIDPSKSSDAQFPTGLGDIS